MDNSFKISDTFVVYKHNQYYMEQPEQGLIFTTKAAAEVFARRLTMGKSRQVLKVATLNEFMIDYARFMEDRGYELGSSNPRCCSM